MKLSRWLTDKQLSVADFAVRINRSRQAVHDLCRGAAQPSLATLSAIKIATSGAVDLDDFVRAEDPEQASVDKKEKMAARR